MIWQLTYRPFVEVDGNNPFKSILFLLNKDKDDGSLYDHKDSDVKVNIEINQIHYKKNSEILVKVLHKEFLSDDNIDIIKDYFETY